MPGKDPSHWLHRLDQSEWLAAASVELGHTREALERRAQRVAVVHARRAAGMAANAVLVDDERPAWGRSYMEHIAALCDDVSVPEPARAAARVLRDTPPQAPPLLQLGKAAAGDRSVEAAAATLVEWARGCVGGPVSSGGTDR